jgi:hypothetical protein
MAVWQFTLHLIPRLKLLECLGELPVCLDPDLCESTDMESWDDHLLPDDCVTLLDEALPRMEHHWCETVLAWGRYDENIVEVSCQDQHIEWLSVRLDLRHPDPRLPTLVCQISSRSDCYLLTEDLRLIPPHVEPLLTELKQSNAFRFVADPQGWLESFRGMPRLD